MSTIDEQFVEYVVKTIVGDPEQVQITRTIDEKGVLLELQVAQDDLGRVIGKKGSTAQSIRTLLRALGTKNEARYNLKIVDPNEGERPPRPPRDVPAATTKVVADDTAVSSDDAPSSDDEVAAEEPVVEEVIEEPKEESLAEKTRKELEDLDDLDI